MRSRITTPCTQCKAPILIQGAGAKSVEAHRITYTRPNGELHVCGYTLFCSKPCARGYLSGNA